MMAQLKTRESKLKELKQQAKLSLSLSLSLYVGTWESGSMSCPTSRGFRKTNSISSGDVLPTGEKREREREERGGERERVSG